MKVITGKIVDEKPDQSEDLIAENVKGELLPYQAKYRENPNGDTTHEYYLFIPFRYRTDIKTLYLYIELNGVTVVNTYDITQVQDYGDELVLVLKKHK